MRIDQVSKSIYKPLKYLANKGEFDFSQLDEKEIFDAIKDAFSFDAKMIKRDIFIEVQPQLKEIVGRMERLEDGMDYPVLRLTVDLVGEHFVEENVVLKLNPFLCEEIYNALFCGKETKKQVSKAFAKFLAGKFSTDYVAKRSAYLRFVKDLRIKKAQENADIEKEMAEKEYKENLFDIL